MEPTRRLTAAFQVVRCPHTDGGRICRAVLDEAPTWWGEPSVTILPTRAHAPVQGRLCRCRQCRSWVSIAYSRVRRSP